MIKLDDVPQEIRNLAAMNARFSELEIELEELGSEIVVLRNDVHSALEDAGLDG